MGAPRYVVVCGDSPDDCEVHGVFGSAVEAEKWCQRYEEQSLRPYLAFVVEVYPVSNLRQQVMEAEREEADW